MEKYRTIKSHIDFEEIKKTLTHRESEIFSPNATLSENAIRRKPEKNLDFDYRQAFSMDVDRILHSLGYTRYIDKTQVFYLIQNDHITHRVLHVQLLSKIARTIGRFLGLNEDLIEAVSLGHDIGHPPFGHEGERFLSDLCQNHGIGHYVHSVQSIQFLDKLERDGNGWNLCLQTLDGILCHDGEVHNKTLKPCLNKTFQDFDREVNDKIRDPNINLVPMTFEGCVVRMADTISYIGRDLEDAIRLGLIRRIDLPKESVDLLGDTNGTIVYNLVTDVIQTSFKQSFISFSPEVSEALKRLKKFNLEHIYSNPRIKQHLGNIKELYQLLFDGFLEDLEKQQSNSVIYSGFLNGKSEDYLENHSNPEIVRDFIAGMTDNYFLNQCPKHLRPGPVIF